MGRNFVSILFIDIIIESNKNHKSDRICSYAKNFYNDETCKTTGTGATNAKLELGFDTCGVKRERSLEPRGLFVSTTVVLSFHPTFLTKIDRAYTVKCFYMEADKTVSQELEVR